ncbi:MAG TPA: peptidoglycan DD-metalloendopeptidase family protein [Acidiferrobacter sp.]|nr:peptidoglycan DD-metalloendopeptidase family protein [Acidiferrobacter sp.]
MRLPKGRITSRLITGILLALVPLSTLANAQDELRALRSQEAALQRGLDQTLHDRSRALDTLRLSEDRVAQAGRAFVLTRMRERHLLGEVARLKAKEADLRQTRRVERAHLARQATAAYMMGRADSLQLFFSQEDPQVVARMLMYYRYVLRSRARRLQVARQTLHALNETAAAIHVKVGQLAVLAHAKLLQKEALEAAQRRRAGVVQVLSRRVQSGRSQLSVLQARAARLQALVQGLRRLPQVPPHTIPSLHGSFAAFRGKLPLPIPAPFAALRPSASGRNLNRWAGIMIPGTPGEEVRAVFPGRVVYANWLRGYGLLLILQNGGGYMTLYGHNQALLKRVGDFVQGGEVIATVGDSGGFSRPGLYFDLSHNGRPLDPLVWLAR